MTPKKPKHWSKILEEAGQRIRVYERPGSGALWFSVMQGGKKARKSLQTGDRTLAEQRARAIARELARAHLTGEDLRCGITLGQLFTQYHLHHIPTLSAARQCEAEARIEMFTEAWGADMSVADVGAAHIKAYCRKRRSLEIISRGRKTGPEGRRSRGYRTPQPVRDGGLDAEFRWLNSVFNFAAEFKVNGRALLSSNPLPAQAKKRREIGWPKEKNPRRPVASHQRFLETMEHVETVDPDGRLGCILALARFTGRRESAICAIRASDLLLSEERIRAALAEAGLDERRVRHMPHGAIRWAAENDKQGFLFISPISADTAAALETYLRQNPRVGDVPLFPAPRDHSKPIRRDTAAVWLVRAEKLAGLPKLKGGVFHPYRRLWAMVRKSLPDIDVAAAGGWTDTQALTLIYQEADPVGVLLAVNGG